MALAVQIFQIALCVYGFIALSLIMRQIWSDKKMSRIYQGVIHELVKANYELINRLSDLQSQVLADKTGEKERKQ